jgi:hypothetical protein
MSMVAVVVAVAGMLGSPVPLMVFVVERKMYGLRR